MKLWEGAGRVVGATLMVATLGTAAAAPAWAKPPTTVPAPPTTVPAPAPPALTAAQLSLNEQLMALGQRYHEAAVGELNLLQQMSTTKATLATLTTTEAALDAQVAAGQARLLAVQARLDSQTQQLSGAEADLATVQDELARTRTQIKQRAIEAYVGQPATGMAQQLLSSSEGQNVLTRLSYLSSIVAEQQNALQRFQVLKGQAGRLERDVRQARDASSADRITVRTELASLATARAQQDALRQAAQTTATRQAYLIARLQSEKADFESQMSALAAQSAGVTSQLAQLQAGQPTASPGAGGQLSFPIAGAPVTSPFGPRVDPVYGDIRIHTGVDFGAGLGTPIRAAADGVVISAGVLGGYGNCTIVDHGFAVATLYAHQSVLLVLPGQHVVRGEIIGLVGSTGFSTGPHLHFEVRVRGTPVDPIPFL